ncbi:hypothetical protein [Streptomyces sp. NRRL F-2799]|uniref:hypothetical protein n=1 Tax=Streptomyces sp. NRRL F-2799 TaxID=1463844 RepID=UPI00131A4B4F|nr:hypothetical protein [Streptomyces sp. NRRL F-2799]
MLPTAHLIRLLGFHQSTAGPRTRRLRRRIRALPVNIRSLCGASGVLPFGATRTADTLYWDTTASEDPDQWPVVMHCQDAENAGRDPWRRFATPLVPTLAQLVANGMPPEAARSGMQTDLDDTPWAPPPRRPEPTAQQRAALTTGSGLETLITLVPPPEIPVLGKHNWDWIHKRLGTRLPGEYIRLMERYGAGSWCGWLRFNIPFDEDRYALAPWAEWYVETYRARGIPALRRLHRRRPTVLADRRRHAGRLAIDRSTAPCRPRSTAPY